MKRKERSSSTNTAEERKTKKSKKTATVTEDEQESTKLDFSSPEKLFSSLLSPTTTEEFLSEYWEKKPLLIQRKDAEYYGSLFSKADLERLLKKEELKFAQDLNLCRYEDGEKEDLNGEMDAKVTASQVSKEVKEHKATIQFHQPQRFKDILWRLNGHLESVFGSLVGANVYITPPDSQGLAPHYDDVEAFILQLEGKKKWKLYKPMLELSQDYSMDLKQEEIGEPTHDIELQEGDLLYFPRGTIHQAVTPKGSGHSTHITLSTYQENSWGNLLTSVLTDAIDKALESDVEFRRGLPLNYMSYMGLGMKDDSKSKNKQEDFNNQMKHLLTRLVNHVDAHATADKVVTDFVFNRLPPYEQKEDAKKDQGDSEKPPTADSEVKFRYPECVRISVGEANTIPFGVFEADQESENEDKEMSEEEKEEEEEPEDESMEESEEEDKPKKKGKSKTKQEKSKQKGKKGKKKQKEESEDDEEEDEESEEEPKQKSKKGKGKKDEKKKVKKTKEKKSKKGKKKEESEEEEEEEEEEDDEEDESEEEKPKSKKGKSKADAQKKKSEKGKKGKKTSESDDEDDEEDKSFNISEDIEEDSDDDEESDVDDDEGPWVYVHHSLNNIRTSHMMGPQEPSVLKFAISYKDALLHLFHNRHDFIPLKSLPLEDESESMYLITSLWSEGLIRIKE